MVCPYCKIEEQYHLDEDSEPVPCSVAALNKEYEEEDKRHQREREFGTGE